ncbi:DUF4919 domain-containing protein [Flavobacterium salilacus subsp. salilacus]|uniref:DUF4919 domain-containing protein n=1 Tax=Flavobacterium TaxID=237 RepID=UPI00107513AB|nr:MULTISPECIES: DUF4919 domain-containing protein [Flavobacterium]KAF2518436.1 DUF4919 domain-containing protein [Flavobacterium salilacus subsp. salilacus]MBE1615073.1 DUF4919 domain-containing protein [Flavobacterium sp. SaA2.13]
MKKYATLLTLMFCAFVYAQNHEFTAPDYAVIEKNVKDKKSAFYFDKLFERYNRADSTMTLEERRHLYYGYSFQEEYAPYGRAEEQNKLQEILQKEKAEKEDFEKIIEYTDDILKQYPFSLRIKEYRIYSFRELDKDAEAEKESVQATIIIDAILSSGDGTEKETCFYVINTLNEYEILNLLGFDFGGKQSLIDGEYDYLTLAENPYQLEGFYFNVSRCLESFKF